MIADSVDRWLEMLDRNRGTWLAAIGARGLGRDREVEAILEGAREGASDRLVAALCYDARPDDAPPRLRAAVRAYGGFAEAASIQWLERDRLTRDELRELLSTASSRSSAAVLAAVRARTLALRPAPERPSEARIACESSVCSLTLRPAIERMFDACPRSNSSSSRSAPVRSASVSSVVLRAGGPLDSPRSPGQHLVRP